MQKTPMNITKTLTELLNAGANCELDVVKFSDEFMQLCAEHELRLRLEPSQCVVEASGGKESIDVIENPMRRSQFRAVLARIVAISSECSNSIMTPYGGDWEISYSGDQNRRIRVSVQNTPNAQFVELEALNMLIRIGYLTHNRPTN